MTGKELRRLSRSELIELLLAQTIKVEKLEEEVADLKEKLADRVVTMEDAGSIAEASLRLEGVFEAAQKAADVYLENIRRMEAEIEQKYEKTGKDKKRSKSLGRKGRGNG